MKAEAGGDALSEAEPGEHLALLAELSGNSLTGKLSGRRLQRLAAAAAAQGIRDPRAWAALSAHAIELNRSIGCTLNRAAGQTAPEASTAGPEEASSSTISPAGAKAVQQATAKESGAAAGFRHFEALRFLSSFLSAGFKDTELLLSFEDIFLRQLQAFECRHLLQLVHICEQYGYRARRLYVPLFRTLAAQAPSLLFQEIADVFACFASHRVASGKCCLSLLKAAAIQIPNASLSDCIKLCGTLHSLGMARDLHAVTFPDTKNSLSHTDGGTALAAPDESKTAAATVLALIEQRVTFLAEGLPLQLLLDEVQVLPRLEFSWRPYEELAERELMKRLDALGCAEDVEQLADPFATLQYLRAQGSVSQAFLKAMIRWCLSAAYKPATRSQKRPTAEELVMLHDACRECDMADDERLQKAILKFVSNEGGTARHKRFVSPLEYQRNRRYYYLPDLRAGHTPAAS